MIKHYGRLCLMFVLALWASGQALAACSRVGDVGVGSFATQDALYTQAAGTIAAMVGEPWRTPRPLLPPFVIPTFHLPDLFPPQVTSLPETGGATMPSSTPVPSPAAANESLVVSLPTGTSTPWAGESLVIVEAPAVMEPTPTAALLDPSAAPQVILAFQGINVCSEVPMAQLRLENTTQFGLESVQFLILDLTEGVTLFGPAVLDTPFLADASACPPGEALLAPGQAGYLAGSLGVPAPAGHTARAVARLCTLDGVQGSCLDRSVDFIIP